MKRKKYVTTTVVDDRYECRRGGRLHRDDGPAVIHPDGREEYWTNGKRVIYPDGPKYYWGQPKHFKLKNGKQYWRYGGQLHRRDGPAVILPTGERQYWVRGQLHRFSGPAVTNRTDGNPDAWYFYDEYVPAAWVDEWLTLTPRQRKIWLQARFPCM